MSNDLVITPHPLTLEGRTVTCGLGVLPGESLAAFLTRNGVDISQGDWVVTIGGAAVSRPMWDRTHPRPGMLIECRKVAGKKVLAIVAILVIAYFTFGLGVGMVSAGVAAGVGAAGSFAVMAFNAAVYMVGSMLVNKLLGPSTARGNQYDVATPPSYSISGARNRQRPFEPLGLLFGSVRVTPDYAANPYTWFEGEDQLMFMRLQAGVNVGSVSEIKIGDTSITTYSDVMVSRSGFPGSTEKLDDWSNVDSIGGGVLAAAASPGAWVTRTSSANSVRLAVDIGAQLYDMAGDGKFNDATLVLEIERRLLPAGSWGPFDGVSATVTLFSKSTKPVRKTLLSGELTAGQYEVRVRKVTADEATSSKTNSVEWGVLKSYQLDSGSYTDYPQVGIRVRATGQISGSLDAVNWVAQSKAVPVWTGSAWVTQTTSNPGAHILQAARGIFDAAGRLQAGMGLPDDQIDIEGLKAFMVHCAAHGYTFDHYFDAPLSCLEMMEAMATAGLGSLSYHPGTLSVVWMTASDPIEGVVAMGNIKAGTFRVDYQTRATADELEVTCYDRDSNWNPITVRLMAPGVTAPRETARLAPLGNTTQAGLLRSGRLAMGQNIYARKTVSWEMDLEHLTFRRYSVIALSHDLTLWGHSGRLRGASSNAGVVTLDLDDIVPANVSAAVRKVGLRVPGENGYRIFDVQAFAGEVTSLVLSTPWPAGVPFPGDSSANPAHDYLWIFDFQATPGQRLRVIAIEPGNDLKGAKISAVPEMDEFWTYMASGAYTVPPGRPGMDALAVSNIVVTQHQVGVNYDQTTDLTLTFDVSGLYYMAQVWIGEVGADLRLVGETRTRSAGPFRVGNEGTYNIEVRPIDQLGRAGAAGWALYEVVLDDLRTASGSAPVVTLTATGQIFIKPADGGAINPATITLTATPRNIPAPTYQWLVDGVVQAGETAHTLVLAAFAPLDFKQVRVNVSGSDGSTAYDVASVYSLAEGSDGVMAGLENEDQSVACKNDGTPLAAVNIVSKMIAVRGATVLGPLDVTFSVVASAGIESAGGTSGPSAHCTINAATGVIAVTKLVSDYAEAVFRATIGTLTIDKVLTLHKTRAGADAQLLILTSSSFPAFVFDTATSSASSSPPITFKAQVVGLVGVPTWTAEAFDVGGLSLGHIALTGAGLQRVMTADAFTASGTLDTQTVEVTVSLGAFSDTMTVYRGDVSGNLVQVFLDNQNVTVPTDAAGGAGVYTYATTNVLTYVGVTDDTANQTYTITPDAGITATINGTAGPVSGTGAVQVAVSDMTVDSGRVLITSTKGAQVVSKPFNVVKSKAGNAGYALTLAPLTEITLPVDSSGNVTSYLSAWTNYKIFKGTVDDTAGWTVSTANANVTTEVTGNKIQITGLGDGRSISWSALVSPGLPAGWGSVSHMVYGNGKWVLFGTGLYGGTPTDKVRVTADFVTMQEVSIPSGQWGGYQAGAYGAGKFLAVQPSAVTATYIISSDGGATWQTQSLPVAAQYVRAVWVAGKFIVCPYGGSSAYSSSTGLTGSWTPIVIPAAIGGSYYFCEANGVLLLCDYINGLYRSTDGGDTWSGNLFSNIGVPAGNYIWSALNSINGRFVAIFQDSTSITKVSSDGASWVSATTPAPLSKYRAALAVGSLLYVFPETGQTPPTATPFITSDGADWSLGSSPSLVGSGANYATPVFGQPMPDGILPWVRGADGAYLKGTVANLFGANGGSVKLTAVKAGEADLVRTLLVRKEGFGSSSYTISATPSSLLLPANPSGAITSFAAAVVTAKLMKNGQDVTAGWSWAYSTTAGMAPASGASNVATLTGMPSGLDVGSIDFVASKAGAANIKISVPVSKSKLPDLYAYAASPGYVLVPSTKDGVVTSYTGVQTQAHIDKNGTDDTSNWAITWTATAGMTPASGAGALAVITGMVDSLDAGAVTFTATKAGQAPVSGGVAFVKSKGTTNSGPVQGASVMAFSASATYIALKFTGDGQYWVKVGSGGVWREAGDWYFPNGSYGASYWLQANVEAGSPDSPSAGSDSLATWLPLTTDRIWVLQSTVSGLHDCRMSFMFATSSAGANASIARGGLQLIVP